MDCWLPTMCMVLLGVGQTTGLRCYSCKGLVTEDPADYNILRDRIEERDNDEDCLEVGMLRTDTSDCQDSRLARAKCTKLAIDATLSVNGQEVSVTYVKRGCDSVPQDDSDGCWPVDNPFELTSSFDGLAGVDIVDYAGDQCYCSGDACNGSRQTAPATVAPLIGLFAALSLSR